jgi:CheY-like chemotaxis protein
LDDPPERDLAGSLHDVSNALTVMLGWVDGARAAAAPGTEMARALEVIAAQAHSARTIVRKAIGADVPDEPPRRLDDIVDAVLLGLAPEARNALVALRGALDPAAGEVWIRDSAALMQVLTNLLLNAIAVSPAGAAIDVDGDVDGDGQIVIGVADEGPGVPVELRARLFSGGTSTRAGGAGIGLRHAASLARSAGGSLALVDAAQGARFEVRWPSGRAPASVLPPSAKRPAEPLAGVRILVIEDDDAVIDLLDTALTARGASVVSVKARRDLGAALTTGAFDAALLDLSPIEDDVAGTVLAVRAASPAVRLIVISGSGRDLPPLPPSCEASWVRKPFEIAEIVTVVSRR